VLAKRQLLAVIFGRVMSARGRWKNAYPNSITADILPGLPGISGDRSHSEPICWLDWKGNPHRWPENIGVVVDPPAQSNENKLRKFEKDAR